MTVVAVFGVSADGYLQSNSASYATARSGANITASTAEDHVHFGQKPDGSVWRLYEAFLKFTYTAVSTNDRVVSAVIRTCTQEIGSPSVNRDIELRSFDWSATVDAADWRDGSDLASDDLLARVVNFNRSATGRYMYAGSTDLLDRVSTLTSVPIALVSSRQRTGTQPTRDETAAVYASEASGTSLDPALIYTTAPQSRLYGVLGAATSIPGGSWAYLENDLDGTINLRKITAGGVITDISPLGDGFAPPSGSQSFALAADASGNLYVAGRSATSPNAIAVQALLAAGGTWVAGPSAIASLPAHDAPINNIALSVGQPYSGRETVIAAVSHAAGSGYPQEGQPDTAYVIFDRSTLSTLGVGSLMGTVLPGDLPVDAHSANGNEVGTGLDLATNGQPGWGYMASFLRKQIPGDNRALALGRFILNASSTGFSHASYESSLGYGRKDATGKVRVIPCGGTSVALITADADAGYGLTISVQQFSGTDSGSVTMGTVYLAAESIDGMPDGPTISTSQAWDAVYSPTENALWIYYVDTVSGDVVRTSVNLSTYHASRTVVSVHSVDPGETVHALRLSRGPAQNWVLLHTAYRTSGGAEILLPTIDSLNLAPTPPVLDVVGGVDATLPIGLSWTYGDPNIGDTQSAYQLVIEDTAALGVAVVDTGKVASTVSSRTLTGGTLTNGKTYQWRVRTWDALDTVGPYSDWGTFSTAAGGTVTITNPAVDNPPGVNTDEYEVRWSVSGTTQAGYRVWVYRGGVAVFDTGWAASTDTSRVVTGMTSDVQHEIRVQVRNAALVTSNIGTRLITPSYGSPETPLLSVTPLPADGYVLISVDNPLPGEPATGYPPEDFETMPTGWFTSAATLTSSTDQAHQGTHSGKIVATGGAQAVVRAPNVAVIAGQRYTARSWIYTATARSVAMSIDWSGASGYLSTSAETVTIPAGVWTLHTGTGTAPTGSTMASYGPTITGTPTAGVTIYADEVQLIGASDRPDVAYNEIHRRVSPNGEWLVIGTCAPDGSLRDYEAPSGIALDYKARGVAA